MSGSGDRTSVMPPERSSVLPGAAFDRPSPWGGERPSEVPGPPSRTGLDVLSQNEGDLPRRREARDAGAEVVAALFRLVKLSAMHATDNLAVVQRIDEIVEAVRVYGARSGRNVSILFLDDTVFIGGQLLQANRTLYDCARELGAILGRAGVSEVGIARDARPADFHALANVLGEVLRGPRGTRLPERPTPRIRLRAASPLALRRDGPTDRLDPAANAANAYASACVVMRRLYEALGKGKLALPHRVKRVAQRLVDLSAGELPAFLGVTDAKRGAHDEAQRAVNATILTLAMARQITADPVLLSRIAMAALLCDLGRYHVAGAFPGSGRVVPQLGAEQEQRAPAATAMLLTAMGRVNEPSVIRTVMAYEATVVGRRAARGLPYGGARNATLQAYLIAIARAYVDAVSNAPGSRASTADEALTELGERWPEGPGRTALRLLMGALGLFPSGTLVELTTGELAAVVATPDDPAKYSLPRVRIVLDMAGHPVDPPFEVDLTQPEPGMPPRSIRRVVTNAPVDAAPISVRGAAPASVRAPPASTRTPPASTRTPIPASTRSTGSTRSPASTRSPVPPASGRGLGAPPSSAVRAPPPSSRGLAAPSSSLRSPLPPSSRRAPASPVPGRGTIPPTMPSPARIVEADARASRPTPMPPSAPTKPDRPALGSDMDQGWDMLPLSPKAWHSAPMEETLESAQDDDATPPSATSYLESEAPREDVAALLAELDDGIDLGDLDRITPAAPLGVLLSAQTDADPSRAITVAPPPSADPTAYGAYAGGNEDDPDAHGGRTAQYSSTEAELIAQTAPPPPELVAAIVEPARPVTQAPEADPEPLAPEPRPEPTAEGVFAKTPFVHLLVYLLDQKLTGTVTFFPPDGPSHDVYFEQGVAAKMRTGAMIWPLDRVLLNLRLVDEARLMEGLVEISKTKMLLGRYLVTRGHVSRDEVLHALRIQLVHKLVSMCELPPETKYAFYADVNLLKSYGGPEPLQSEPLALIMAAIRAAPGNAASEATLARIARLPLGFVHGTDLTRFELSREETAVCDLLRARRMRVADLVSAGVAPEHVVKRTLYALVITRYLDLGAAQKPPVAFVEAALPTDRPPAAPAPRPAQTRTPTPLLSAITFVDEAPPAPPPPAAIAPKPAPAAAPSAPPAHRPATPSPAASAPRQPATTGAARPAATPAPPAARAPAARTPAPPTTATPKSSVVDLAARRAEIQSRAATVDSETHFEVLGIPRTATGEETRNAYFALAKRWHPDRTPPELADLKPLVASIFAKIGEAYSTIGDAEKRKAYLKSLENPSTARNAAEEEQVVRAVNAAVEFQKAEALVKKNDLAGAERHIKLAADADPGQPEYITLLAWIMALRRGEPKELPGGVSHHYDDVIQMLDEVLRGDSQYEKALFYRGVLLKRSGRIDKAMRDFRLVAELNPRNIDAVREVRLHEMRKREAKENATGQSGLFGKWFKR